MVGFKMRIDPYNHKERYLKWKEETKEEIEGLNEYNFQILKRYLSDMERGLNVAAGSAKGPRGFSRLNTIKDRFMVFSRNYYSVIRRYAYNSRQF